VRYTGGSELKQKWYCPVCPTSSGRYWNLGRHISRKHAGLCRPIRKDTSFHQQNISSQPFGFQTMSSYFDLLHNFQSPRKRYDTSDSIEKILEPLRKISEFKILTSHLFPPNLPPLYKVCHNLQSPQTVDFTSRQPVQVRTEHHYE
jgi:hypothetical protein